ncbi:putative Carbohydrate-binding family V/XII protein [Vibrio nigripulchritudo SFn27]|uniref:Putative Carbohydrate-binding family V/XII protein n=1 Tax=Vibrio nigripulchritudo TaxID=28173 RepID=U4K1Z7_9VIBR|nr:carbohydrate-binding protein [Vibrio nigripulchritudo]CCN85346.1 putative Carbohydrate-binding family V/XII protein [Vibrio nigripulchritudo BLFn1]CCN87902.1 putative Carbohydrate-binding family V/XII protein [Vibrio nigripulchritudo SFn27]CCN94487.1 putative Carbohydrate-binding family V/XII protein [Vibrio nigripulchritudo ENn2]CCO41412.1 putative Carbohydrate-binding family V/XII protein [Vibrio nigripulchritudo SFn135]CCO54413.1 putative Carbohydrate-binding family V/XII protein [Vibrio
MKFSTTARSALMIATLGLSTQAAAFQSFDTTTGKPDAQECSYLADAGKNAFDANTGKLWACSTQGWVFFESQSAHKCLNASKAEQAKYPAWKKGRTYVGGNKVLFNNKVYRAKWWTRTGTPATSEAWTLDVKDVHPKTWNQNHQYNSGENVLFMGHVYEANHWSKGKLPPANVSQNNRSKEWRYVGPFECANN